MNANNLQEKMKEKDYSQVLVDGIRNAVKVGFDDVKNFQGDITQEFRNSRALNNIYAFLMRLKYSGYPLLYSSLTKEEKDAEKITNRWGWTQTLSLEGVVENMLHFVVCITFQGDMMLENYRQVTKHTIKQNLK